MKIEIFPDVAIEENGLKPLCNKGQDFSDVFSMWNPTTEADKWKGFTRFSTKDNLFAVIDFKERRD